MGTASPAAKDCQAAFGTISATDVSGQFEQVDGNAIGRNGLVALRAARGNALIIVRGGNFTGADFRNTRIHNICFVATNLARSDWRGAHAQGVGFVHSNLAGANLRGAWMPRALFSTADLERADASGANFSSGKLEGTALGSLQDLRLDRANLTRFVFDCGITEEDRCAHEKRISFRDANLSRAAISSYYGGADWTNARLDGTGVSLRQLTDLRTARVVGPLVLRGGGASVRISGSEYRTILSHLSPEEEARTPSFTCDRARTRVEREICGPEGGRLRRLDRVVAGLYAEARMIDPNVWARQQVWLRARDRCDRNCLLDSYRRRRDELIIRIGRPHWARPGRRELFVAPSIELDEAFRTSPLYRRMLPVIIGSASSYLVVRVNADGSIAAAGSAIGGNAHLCSLGGDRLNFDPKTGWISGTPVARPGDPPAWRKQPVPLLRFWGDHAEIYDRGHPPIQDDLRYLDYMQCGARAGFDEMVRIPATAALFTRLRAELNSRVGGDDDLIWALAR